MYFADEYDDKDFHDLDDPDAPDDHESENYLNKTYVCEECDFRWTDTIYPERNDYPDYDDELGQAHICPMCGSTNVSFY